MSDLTSEPIFCTECQNEVKVEDARILDGRILCPADLGKKSFFDKVRARKLPQNYKRRSGRFFQSMFTSIAALMLVVGVVVTVGGVRGKRETAGPERAVVAETPDVSAEQQARAIAEEAKEDKETPVAGIMIIFAAVVTALFGVLAGDVVDLLLDVLDQLRHAGRR